MMTRRRCSIATVLHNVASNDKANEDLPPQVRHRLSELPKEVWAGKLADGAFSRIIIRSVA